VDGSNTNYITLVLTASFHDNHGISWYQMWNHSGFCFSNRLWRWKWW